jgi:NADPH2:quinone reductase
MPQAINDTIPAFMPAGDDRLVVLGEAPAPEPEPGELLLAVEAYSVNRGETFLLESGRENWRPGQDVAGRVLRAAADGLGPAEGTRVVGHAPQGGWATQVAVPTGAVATLPDGVSPTDAATLGVAALTALRLLRATGDLASRRVLLTGASGGVGHFLVEMAAARGALLTAVTRSPERGERLLALGAEAVVHDVADAEGPFDLILESVGGPTLETALTKAGVGATVMWFGQAGREPATLDLMSVIGVAPYASMIPWTYWRTGASDADDLATLVRLVDQGHLHPEIGVCEDWAKTPEVLAAVRDRQVRGNAVLTVGA